jgi:hypothetical protein
MSMAHLASHTSTQAVSAKESKVRSQDFVSLRPEPL